jgi:uncharacterized membrane-anchored protein YitT (DUF2179 family)
MHSLLKNNITKKKLINFAKINSALFLIALTARIFIVPNNFTLGGVAGLSILTSTFVTNVPVSIIMLFLNIFIILLGWVFLGKDIAIKSSYGAITISLMLYVLETFIPIIGTVTDETLLELFIAVFLYGIGAAILISSGGSAGGTEIVARIFNKIFKIKITVAFLIIDFTIVSMSFIIFDTTIFLLSMFGVIVRIIILDFIIEALNVSKIIVITSQDSKAIKDFIIKDLKRGATYHDAKGLYTDQNKKVITTILNRKESIKLQTFIDDLGIVAFITITDTTRVIGNGFKRSI